MKAISEKARKAVVRKRTANTCICCTDRVSAKDSDIYSFKFSSAKKYPYAIVCNKCAAALEGKGLCDDNIPNYIASLRINAFLHLVEKKANAKKEKAKNCRSNK